MTTHATIDVTNPGHVKLALLSQGISPPDRSVFEGPDYAENQFPYGHSSALVQRYHFIPAEIILPQDVYVGIHLRAGSPWRLETKDGTPCLYYRTKQVFPVSYIPRPDFYGKRLTNGQLCEKVAVLYGSKYTLSFFTRGWCYFFHVKKQCKFCSLNPTRKTIGGTNEVFIRPDIAREAAKLAFGSKNDVRYINHCAGAFADNDRGIILQMSIVSSLQDISRSHRTRQHMLTIPPDNFDLLTELKRAGLGTINYALEVYDRKLFEKICPGKQKYYGREKYMQVFQKTAEVFGAGNAYSNFVGGLEPVSSMKRGFARLASYGVAPSINVFHPDPMSVFRNRKPPTISYLFQMVKVQSDIYVKNKFRAIFPHGGTRNSLDTEVAKGFFN